MNYEMLLGKYTAEATMEKLTTEETIEYVYNRLTENGYLTNRGDVENGVKIVIGFINNYEDYKDL